MTCRMRFSPHLSLLIPHYHLNLAIEIHLRVHNLSLVPLKIKKTVLKYKINEEILFL